MAMLRLVVTPSAVSLGRSESGCAKISSDPSALMRLGRSESGYTEIGIDSCGGEFGEK